MPVSCFVFIASCVVTSGLAALSDDGFKMMVLEELQTMKTKHTQLEQKITGLKSENQILKEEMSRHTAYRRQTGSASQEVAFNAYVSQHLPHLSANEKIIFDHVKLNSGGHYNERVGVFVAPVSGTYMLFANILTEIGEAIETVMMADGHAIVNIYSAGTDHFGAGSNMALRHLEQGTSVWVEVHDNYGTSLAVHCCWSTFSGYLLRASDDGPLVVVGNSTTKTNKHTAAPVF